MDITNPILSLGFMTHVLNFPRMGWYTITPQRDHCNTCLLSRDTSSMTRSTSLILLMEAMNYLYFQHGKTIFAQDVLGLVSGSINWSNRIDPGFDNEGLASGKRDN